MTEREWIRNRFILPGRKGRFLDIGAFDGVTDSLTHDLALAGWSGVCVEPDAETFCKLRETYAGNGAVSLINSAVTPHGGMMAFWKSTNDAQNSTASRLHAECCESRGIRFHKYTMATISPHVLLRNINGLRDLNFITIDAEGLTQEIVEMLPLQSMVGTEAICVEHPGDTAFLVSLLRPLYDIKLITDANIIAVRSGAAG